MVARSSKLTQIFVTSNNVRVGMSLNLAEPLFSCLWNGDNNSTYRSQL